MSDVEKRDNGGAGAAGADDEHPRMDFSTFIASLSTSAIINMGIVDNPVTGKRDKDIEAARQTIDLIEMLKAKTAGNLDDDEARLIDDVLHELRVAYCRVVA